MDVFVFPSRTDAFGNVLLEAMASGVPPIVTVSGGPKLLVESGFSGFVAVDDQDFILKTLAVVSSASLRRALGVAARSEACSRSWESVFDKVYEAYRECIESAGNRVTATKMESPVMSLQHGPVEVVKNAERVAQLAD
jgi:glycosyltransferase involved in cell wall biosynthesis